MTTEFERSGGLRTPDYAGTVDYCRRLAASSRRVHFSTFGTSGEGRALPLLVVDANGYTDPERIHRAGKAVVLIQAGIHSGEIDGKDAGLMLIRDITAQDSLTSLLDHVSIVFIPILNVDGHERSSPYNRVNQNGPESMGWRTNASNLNLNRDYLKADTPEIRAWLALYNRWQPDLFIDCHVTDGADYQYVLTYVIERWQNADPAVARWSAERFQAPLERRMRAAGLPLAPYCDFRVWHDPRSGLQSFASTPRFSTGYVALRNRPAMLIEAHMLKDYATRVRATYRMLTETLRIVNREADTLRAIVAEADERVRQPAFRADPLPMTWTTSFTESTMVDFLGFDYTIDRSDLTGGDWPRFSDRPVTLQVPYFGAQRTTASARLPEAYIIAPQWTEAIARVEAHGLACFRLRESTRLTISTVRFDNVAWSAAPFEGRHQLTYDWNEIEETREFPAGSVVVDLAQPGVRVAAQLFEPAGTDALVRWGFFDACFEQKEYVESYVIEQIARDMLAADPALADEFAAARKDPAFAASPARIRDWFYQRTPYVDQRIRIYPIARIRDRATVEQLRRAAR
ncbi:MAG TPA: M14 family metallopeptidase [Candidatus Krumholzibacteria bacterium]|nr:M14 family metallopeptidase [Candidatus Krumholzibacteria bacterium]